MAEELVLYEQEINTLLREYLSFSGMEKTSYSLMTECKEKGKSVPTGRSLQATDGSKLAAQNNILLEFDGGQHSSFWKLWVEHVPSDIRSNDYTCQRLEFYVQIHFAIYPIRLSSPSTPNNSHFQNAMTRFKTYLETSGASLSQTTEFLPFYALPFVPNPVNHPSFKDLFSPNWIPELRGRVEKFLSAALSAAEPPMLLTLIKNKDRLLQSEDTSNQVSSQLQQQLVQAERRCGVYMKRFNKLQTDYHTLISITAELVDSLEQTVHGKMVTVEYLQSVCARLFRNQTVGGSINNLGSVDFTRPGTASSLLRASIIQENIVEYSDDVTYLPSLDYNKVKEDLIRGSDKIKSLLLQALRWRLTRSIAGEQRDAVVDAYIGNDLFGCKREMSFPTFFMLNLLKSPNHVVRQYAARLYNALASLRKGRSYLCEYPDGVRQLQAALLQMNEETDKMCKEHLLGCLQKLSLRRPLQTVMIEGNLLGWLISTLSQYESLSDYLLEYAIALLMNLCLRSSGKRKCGEHAKDVLNVLSKLLAHENVEIRPYVNGALYSVLSNPRVRQEALEMELESILRDLMEGEQPEFKRQLEFIIRQLNADSSYEVSDGDDSDDNSDEDDDEDQDAMEADLDKDEILQLTPRELSGEKFLCSDYLGLLTNTFPQQARAEHATVLSSPNNSGIPLRPLTPSYHRAGGDFIHSQEQNTSNRIAEDGENVNLLMSTNSTLVGSVQSLPRSRPPTSAGLRNGSGSNPQSRNSNRRLQSSDRPRTSSSSRSVTNSKEVSASLPDTTGSEGLVLQTNKTENLRNPSLQPHLLPPDTQDCTAVFTSRPRILRTPDVSGQSGRGFQPPNPTYSFNEPTSRSVSVSSRQGSKSSTGSSSQHVRSNRRQIN